MTNVTKKRQIERHASARAKTQTTRQIQNCAISWQEFAVSFETVCANWNMTNNFKKHVITRQWNYNKNRKLNKFIPQFFLLTHSLKSLYEGSAVMSLTMDFRPIPYSNSLLSLRFRFFCDVFNQSQAHFNSNQNRSSDKFVRRKMHNYEVGFDSSFTSWPQMFGTIFLAFQITSYRLISSVAITCYNLKLNELYKT